MIGSTSTPTASHPIEFRKAMRIRTNPSISTWLNIDNTGHMGTGMVIYPNVNSHIMLGKNDLRFHQIYTYQLFTGSDMRDKANIRPIGGALSTVLQLNGVRYSLKRDLYATPHDGEREAKPSEDLGFLAQEVIDVLPELVMHTDSSDAYSINYIGMIPLLTEAIKELHGQVVALEAQVQRLQGDEPDARAKNEPLADNPLPDGKAAEAHLAQNAPNPFSSSTTVRYGLPATVKQANLYIYTLQGAQVRSYPLPERGEASLTIAGGELQPGIYIYTLIADGREVESRRMILTK